MFIEQYKKLLIIQYADKPKATAHIELLLKMLEKIYTLSNSLKDAFNLDTAEGKQLDILGKIVGINRNVPFVVPNNYFGFEGHTNSYPMDDLFKTVVAYPFKDLFEFPYSAGVLNDKNYRFFIKGKAIQNNTIGKMIDDGGMSIQNAIDYLFDNKAYVVDNYNMTLDIYIDSTFDFDLLRYLKQLDLLPRPQGVKYVGTISYVESNTFGFYDHDSTFGDLNDPETGGFFAEIIL